MNRPIIDFTDCSVNKFIACGGAIGNKIDIGFHQKSYMLNIHDSSAAPVTVCVYFADNLRLNCGEMVRFIWYA